MWVIDEAHEGIDTGRTEEAFRNIKRRFTLHLSGTPFRALRNDKFTHEQIFSWTYIDERKVGVGSGPNKKVAHQDAAHRALLALCQADPSVAEELSIPQGEQGLIDLP